MFLVTVLDFVCNVATLCAGNLHVVTVQRCDVIVCPVTSLISDTSQVNDAEFNSSQ